MKSIRSLTIVLPKEPLQDRLRMPSMFYVFARHSIRCGLIAGMAALGRHAGPGSSL